MFDKRLGEGRPRQGSGTGMGVLFWLYVEARNCAAQQVAKILEAND